MVADGRFLLLVYLYLSTGKKLSTVRVLNIYVKRMC